MRERDEKRKKERKVREKRRERVITFIINLGPYLAVA